MDKIKETIEMLQGIKIAAEDIETTEIGGCGYSTLVRGVKRNDSFNWVIEEAIALLNELQEVKSQRMFVVKNTDKNLKNKFKELLSGNKGLCYPSSVEILPLNTINKSTYLSQDNVEITVQVTSVGMYSITFEDNSEKFASCWKMNLTPTEAKRLTQNMINMFGGEL